MDLFELLDELLDRVSRTIDDDSESLPSHVDLHWDLICEEACYVKSNDRCDRQNVHYFHHGLAVIESCLF